MRTRHTVRMTAPARQGSESPPSLLPLVQYGSDESENSDNESPPPPLTQKRRIYSSPPPSTERLAVSKADESFHQQLLISREGTPVPDRQEQPENELGSKQGKTLTNTENIHAINSADNTDPKGEGIPADGIHADQEPSTPTSEERDELISSNGTRGEVETFKSTGLLEEVDPSKQERPSPPRGRQTVRRGRGHGRGWAGHVDSRLAKQTQERATTPKNLPSLALPETITTSQQNVEAEVVLAVAYDLGDGAVGDVDNDDEPLVQYDVANDLPPIDQFANDDFDVPFDQLADDVDDESLDQQADNDVAPLVQQADDDDVAPLVQQADDDDDAPLVQHADANDDAPLVQHADDDDDDAPLVQRRDDSADETPSVQVSMTAAPVARVEPDPAQHLVHPQGLMIGSYVGNALQKLRSIRSTPCTNCQAARITCEQPTNCSFKCVACQEKKTATCSWHKGMYHMQVFYSNDN